MSRLWLIGIVLLALAGCPSATPIAASSTKLAGYIKEKQQFAADLQQVLVGKLSDSYRLVAVTGPAYPPGAVLDPDNPVDVLTRDCIIANDKLPSSEPWADFPTWTSKNKIDLGLGLPLSIKTVLLQADVNLAAGTASEFGFSDISQRLVARDDFLNQLDTPNCQKAILGADVVVVRGVVEAKETFGSGSDVTFGAGAGIKTVGNLKLQWDHAGHFQLADKAPAPKLLIVTLLKKARRSGSLEGSLIAPSQETLDRIAAESAKRADTAAL